ncbi:hypothetical protein M406DRAFT_344062 [Cryphonectria parasitica EP155]|uniref:C2H2-type domain-containing protein n=1 Tax=Cryphonectria parasitica (strain ATCC 38755 / EP155) TaxID=660469 RepID=A0A9P4YBW4_CRYP1|nr:uncharacterized protein M406DRAFT_344062 [Cryphonectria parasitica EP155]KAF3770213.1 hypothetical protein M406DRAFT_344062 [Cryphonectria parasitica EP155]
MTTAHDVYDPDAVVPQNSPLLVARKVNTQPSPSPEPELPRVQISPPPRSQNGKAKRPKVRPSQGDAVLIGIMGNGRDPEIAAQAGQVALVSDSEGSTSPDSDDADADERDLASAPMDIRGRRKADSDDGEVDVIETGALSPESSLADTALAALALGDRHSVSDDGRAPATFPDLATGRPQTAVRRDDIQHRVISSPYSPSSIYSPRTGSFASPTGSVGHGELAPIQNTSPRSESNAGLTLPSLKESLGAEALSPASFSQSPTGGLPVGMSLIHSSHVSPPISPQDMLPRSPHQPFIPPGPYHPFLGNGMPHRPSMDYSGSTPSDQSVSTPATSTSVAERMNLDGIAFANPMDHGQYHCSFEGCKAPPFQTQYLLNSHANVHSQARPHYCPVKGCPRSEGGKGFKRKNEMIRHGLVHESPGYVCPFCPDREHKYPRPDNLQRHVRVHHPDKDKDDMILRSVLSQRPDGPSRGRRRRGAS